MLRFFKINLAVSFMVMTIQQAGAFSLEGPYATDSGSLWQIPQVGYNLPGDIGGPMNIGQEYRWNTPNIYYAVDSPFLNFFGARGSQEIDKAVKVVNDLPAMSSINIDNYPLKSERINFRAQALGLADLKSVALAYLVEELGLSTPSRWVFTLRARPLVGPPVTNYFVIQRNFDPVTLSPSSYINGDLWTFNTIVETAFPSAFPNNVRVDPLAYGNPVADRSLNLGTFYTGLTRDDVGGLRYIYRQPNQNVENAITNAFGGSSFGGGVSTGGGTAPWLPIFPAGTNGTGGSVPIPSTGTGIPPWLPIFPSGGTNATTTPGTPANPVTNAFINTSLRGGIDKINLVKAEYDSLLGQFVAFTSTFNDAFTTNNATRTQVLQRIVNAPDILFTAADLGTTPDANFFSGFVGRTAGWVNNSTLNGATAAGAAPLSGGPGTIEPTVTIIFNSVGPLFFNGFWPFNLNEDSSTFVFAWGTFDGTTNEPVVYPSGISISDLERQVLGGR
jgi:hypothetical protein